MIKVSTFLAESVHGLAAVPLFGAADGAFEKVASVGLLPEVVRYINVLRPKKESQYVLVNALGAGEYFGSNVNGDHFPEEALMHSPDGWTGNPLIDRGLSKDWPYGFPTFYNAHPFAHHKNKDPSRAYGEVELAVWNDHMKRVELVVRVDYDRCVQFGGTPVWDRLKAGQFPDVSMGCLPAGSLITMADGTQKPIELVRESEWVLTHTGAHRRVTDTMKRHHPGSVFRFNVYGFRRALVVTGNHPLWLVDGEQLQCTPQPKTVNCGRKQRHCTPFVRTTSKGCAGCERVPAYDFEWRRADEAQVGDYLAFPVPTLSTSGVLSGNRSLARLLGYYLAEGHVSSYNDRPREQVNFSLNYEEHELAEEIEQLARALGVEVLWHYEKPEVGARTVSFVSKRLASLCSGHCGDGAKTKTLSKEVLHEDPEILMELLGAYLNGDGGTYQGSAYFSTSSEQLAHQLFIALARCGLVASINKNEHKPSEKSVVRKDTTEYQVWVGTDFSWKLEPYISKPVRKSLKVRGQRFFYEKDGVTYLMAPVLEIDEAPHDADVFNFSVDGDESYVAEGLAVHNSKVPWDLCCICGDWELYKKALSTFDPKKHRHPGIAVLEFHKKLKAKNGVGIRGLSITRSDYCDHASKLMNRIFPDGRKSFVYNFFPRFFDISFVFIGADRTAKVMVFIVQSGRSFGLPSVMAAEKMGLSDDDDEGSEKTASAMTDAFDEFLLKGAAEKQGTIEKEVVPSQFAGKALPLLTENEEDLPDEAMNALCSVPMSKALATLTGLGMVLRPREFKNLSERKGNDLDVSMDEGDFMPGLARLLRPFMHARSALGPYIERRVVIISSSPKKGKEETSSLPSEELRKIGAAYGDYRRNVMELVASTQQLIKSAATANDRELHKLAEASAEDLFTPLAYCYLDGAFKDEAPFAIQYEEMVEKVSVAGVERGLPSRNTWTRHPMLPEGDSK